ncbi:phospholipase [Roseomonas sp. HF4]|uniref:phospholipase n=1 Tax=Roseomonas sp. HF4 TaxID=2562313 RepID=UPI0010C0FB38|nr:phospholipase [Roseomonas sp. HF4]
MAGPDPVGAAIATLVPETLAALARLEAAARTLDPETLGALAAAFDGAGEPLRAALAASRTAPWPDGLVPLRACLEGAAAAALGGLDGLAALTDAPDPLRAAARALRAHAEGCEAIYPLAAFIPAVSEHFLDPPARADRDLALRLAAVQPGRDGAGSLHLGGPPGTRGGAALYVPEWLDPTAPAPLVVALHGGSGDGRRFLWAFLRAARSRGWVVLAPTAAGRTWSLAEPEADGAGIRALVAQAAALRPLLPAPRLLAGMSDGGTFAYTFGLGAGAADFTHLAPVAAAFNRFVMGFANPARVQGLPVRILHGAQDWMFPAETARDAAAALAAAGARVAHREIEDLAHAWPSEETGAILDWCAAPG